MYKHLLGGKIRFFRHILMLKQPNFFILFLNMDLYVLQSMLFHLKLKLMSIKTVCCRPKTFPDPYFYLRKLQYTKISLIYETFERIITVNLILTNQI